MEPVSALVDPSGATAASDALLAAIGSGTVEPVSDEPPKAPDVLDAEVRLPGGYLDIPAGGTLDRVAEVRELDGEDEEIIARAGGNFAKMLDTILQRGVVSVGEKRATKDVLDQMLAGDRDALLVAIRRVTFGDEVELVDVTCPECGEKQEPVVHLSTDVPTKVLDDPYDQTFSLTLATGKVVQVNLPTGSVQRAMASVEERTEAALNTVLLAKCVKTINGMPVITEDQVRKGLTIRERREVIKEVDDRTPGPRLGEVKVPCSSCEEEIPVPLSLVALFLF